MNKTIVLLIGLMCLAGCTPMEMMEVSFDTAPKLENPTQSFLAGAATTDITPPPGSLPRAGYATWSTIGEGFRTRLYSRVYYLKDKEGDSHLIVQTDLTTGSRVLHTRLGEILSQSTDIDASRITVTATHSHSAPGQIVGSQFYNKHISHVSGFAEDYFDFLLDRIASAAQEAIRSAAPAKLATGKVDIWGLTRNRSIQAYVENDNVVDKTIGDERTFHSVNPAMYMVRMDTLLDDGSTKPLGAFASFSIHGTALPQKETLFNADVWAYIHKDWEWEIARSFPEAGKVHVSAFEGTHGDVAPASRFDMLGYIEAKRVGKDIAKKAIALYSSLENSLTDDVDIQSAIKHVNLRKENEVDGVAICEDAAAGMTLAAAPLEHTSPVIGYLPFFKQGSRRWGDEEDNCQGRKRILGFSWGQPLLEPKDSFPDYVLFQLIKINDLVIAPYPFEVTVESGKRLATDVLDAYNQQTDAVKHVMVTSLAGGYTGYVTTPEEYGRQYYEGGHTIYGKNTLPYLRAHTRQLANAMRQSGAQIVSLPEKWVYQFETRHFLPQAHEVKSERQVLSSPAFFHAQQNSEGYWQFKWRDAGPSHMMFHQPLLSIEIKSAHSDQWQPLEIEGVKVNDEGYDLAVRLEEEVDDKGMAAYSGYWFNPIFQGESYEYRFVVAERAGFDKFYSPAFH